MERGFQKLRRRRISVCICNPVQSSVLYETDDTDIFADKNEGKVLIMDNPFAQTNASHLLIPLMDMAKRATHSLSVLPVWAESPSIIVLTIYMC